MIGWTDVESTGLDEKIGDLLEVAIVVTDDQLKEVAEMSFLIVPPDLDATIAKMDPYVRDMHTKNGLIDDLKSLSRERGSADSLANIQSRMMTLVAEAFKDQPVIMTDRCALCKLSLKSHLWGKEIDNPQAYCKSEVPGKFQPKFDTPISMTPLAGSTIPFDRRWLKQHMPLLEGLFSYRSIDVSTLTELAKRFAPAVYNARPKKGEAHRALLDVRESINYLRYYRENGLFGNGYDRAKLDEKR